jgi:hypothetical protein
MYLQASTKNTLNVCNAHRSLKKSIFLQSGINGADIAAAGMRHFQTLGKIFLCLHWCIIFHGIVLFIHKFSMCLMCYMCGK